MIISAVEYLSDIEKVASSNLASSTKIYGDIVQLVEHLLHTETVGSSSLSNTTNQFMPG
jgi:hypothetical protein